MCFFQSAVDSQKYISVSILSLCFPYCFGADWGEITHFKWQVKAFCLGGTLLLEGTIAAGYLLLTCVLSAFTCMFTCSSHNCPSSEYSFTPF